MKTQNYFTDMKIVSSNSIKKIERGDGSWDEKFGDISTIDVILGIFYYFTRFIDP